MNRHLRHDLPLKVPEEASSLYIAEIEAISPTS
jgi:hypothetical protein